MYDFEENRMMRKDTRQRLSHSVKVDKGLTDFIAAILLALRHTLTITC
jgi:hypothetical protein